MAFLGSTHGPRALLELAPVAFGALFWALRGRHRRGVRDNLRRILGPRSWLRERRDEMGTFIAFARSFAEGFAAMGARRGEVRIETEGAEHFDLIAARAQGCILVTAHTSSFELAGAALGHAREVEIVMAMRAEPNAAARRISDGARARGGLRVVHVGDDPLVALTLAGHLRRGAVVGLQIDRMPPGTRGLPVTLFGTPALLPMGPFALARATGSAILPVFTRRTGFLRARVRACAPVCVARRSTEAELCAAAQRVADAFEAWVREAPNEWLDWGGA